MPPEGATPRRTSRPPARPRWARSPRGGAAVLRGIPVYTQPDDVSCGPTGCAMVLKYYGVSAGIGPLKTKAGTRWLEAGSVHVGLTVPSGIANTSPICL